MKLKSEDLEKFEKNVSSRYRCLPKMSADTRSMILLNEGQILMNALALYADPDNWTEDGRFVPTVTSQLDPAYEAREAINSLRKRP
jgi:hypothetical protein